MSNFIEQCLLGEVLMEEIDDYVDQWHESGNDMPIHKFLGMKRSEYSLWLSDPDMLPFIICAHRENKGVDLVIEEFNALPLAARSTDATKVTKLIKWLKKEGLWEQ